MQTKGCQDIISTIRNGSAAENAVAIMQEKGFPLQRRSRHRLTPGTVKFAAYHVLSLEGSKGMTVIELTHKIQVMICLRWMALCTPCFFLIFSCLLEEIRTS